MSVATLIALAALAQGDTPAPVDVVTALENATIRAIDRARPSVVAIARIRGDEPETITAIKGEPPPVNIPTGPDNKPVRFDYAAPGDFSSGVVIGPDNAILTTYHTLRGAVQIWVRAIDRAGERKEFEAVIIAADPRSDLAVIVPREADAATHKLIPITVGDASKLRPGSFLIAMGNPFNAARDGRASAAWGILSNNARKIHPPASEGMGIGIRGQFFQYQPTLLQLDSKLNMGMSGGAVVNMRGELVGLTTAAASTVAYDLQAGYAIPMDALGRKVVDTLRLGQEVEYGFLGISLSNDVNSPNTVSQVTPGTPAEKASLVQGDMILAVNGRKLDAEDGLTMALAVVPIGQDAKLTIRRNGEIHETSIFVSKYPINGRTIATSRPKPWRGVRVDFTSILANDPAFNFNPGIMALGGVVVTEVEPGSPAETAGLKRLSIIAEVDGKPIVTPADFRKAMAASEGKDVTLTLQPTSFGERKITIKGK